MSISSVRPLTVAQMMARRRFDHQVLRAVEAGQVLPCPQEPDRWDANDAESAAAVEQECRQCPVFEACAMLAIAGGFTWGILAGRSADDWAAVRSSA